MEVIYTTQRALKIRSTVLQLQNFTRLIAIGASAGGVETLKELLLNLPEQLVNITIFIGFPIDKKNKRLLSTAINSKSSIALKQAKQDEEIKAGIAYFTEPGYELDIKGNHIQLNLTQAGVQSNQADKLFESLSDAAGEKSIAIVLSGMGSDGAKGVKKLKESGGFVLVQAPPTAMYNAMPIAAINTGCADWVIPPYQMGNAILNAVQLQLVQSREYTFQNQPESKQPLPEIAIRLKTNEAISKSISGFIPAAFYCNENISSVDSMVKETIFNCYQHSYLIVNSSFIIQEVKGDISPLVTGLSELKNLQLWSVINAELKAAVMAAITKATTTQQVVKSSVQKIELNNDLYFVRIIVKPILNTAGAAAFYLIILENLQTEKFDLKSVQKMQTTQE